ncbi:hypothetical protein [Bacillus sp. FJAT-45037]|uniref:hypothetical protein n=1 Tax=Bacillus sp. FJAT-45037 TaxID=2011007 RepID=UPI0012FD240F|nr:hypothetical protein [Bacillus sp. FJAT-45037]
MSATKEATGFTEHQLKDLLQQFQKKGSEQTDVTSTQFIEEMASVLRPFVNMEEVQ